MAKQMYRNAKNREIHMYVFLLHLSHETFSGALYVFMYECICIFVYAHCILCILKYIQQNTQNSLRSQLGNSINV